MAKRTSFINIKQEVSLHDSKNRNKLNKNFSVTFNTMVEHIEELYKLDCLGYEENSKYIYHKGEGYKFIYLTYNKNNGKYIIKMSNEGKDDDENKDKEEAKNDYEEDIQLKLYSFEYAKKNKSNTKTIVRILNKHKKDEKSNIKKESIKSLKDLIERYDQNGKNTFFLQSKGYCIKEITSVVKSEFSAKKIYTMLTNQLNYYKGITLEKIKNYKGEDIGLSKERCQTYLGNLECLNNITSELLNSYKYIFEDNHKKVFNIYNSLMNIDFNTYTKDTNGNNIYCLNFNEESQNTNNNIKLREQHFHNYIHQSGDMSFQKEVAESPEVYEEMDKYNKSMIEGSSYVTQDDLLELQVQTSTEEKDPNENIYSVKHHQMYDEMNTIISEKDYDNPLCKLKDLINKDNIEKYYYSKNEIEFMQDYIHNIVNHIKECYKSHYIYLKIDKNSSFLLGLVNLFYNYFEIKLFEKTNNYKNRLTMIKKFYRNKISNSNNYNEDYDDYLDNAKLRAQKVMEIEFLDNLMIENKKIFENIFKIDNNTKSSNDIHIIMDALENKIIDKYQMNLTMMENRLKKLDRVEYLYYMMNDIEVDRNKPRRIITRSEEGIELFCKYRYENKIYPKYKSSKHVLELTFEDFTNGFEENIPDKEYFTKRFLYKKKD